MPSRDWRHDRQPGQADEPHAGREITAALDRGYAVVLVSADGREHILTAQAPAA